MRNIIIAVFITTIISTVLTTLNCKQLADKDLEFYKRQNPSPIYTQIFPTVTIGGYGDSCTSVKSIVSDTMFVTYYRYRKFKIVEYVSTDNTHFFIADSIYTRSDIYTKIK